MSCYNSYIRYFLSFGNSFTQLEIPRQTWRGVKGFQVTMRLCTHCMSTSEHSKILVNLSGCLGLSHYEDMVNKFCISVGFSAL